MNTNATSEKRIRFGAYIPQNFDRFSEEQVAGLAEAGIDLPIIGFADSFAKLPRAEQLRALDLYEKNGLQAIFFDTEIMSRMDVLGSDAAWLYDDGKYAAADDYKNHPAIAGNCFVDEPGILHFEKLGETIEAYKRRFPGKVPYVNLLPMYANNAQLTGGAWMADIEYYDTSNNDFQEYMNQYVKHVNTDYICVDIYPCHIRDGKKRTYRNYVKAIELTAKACRDSDRDFWVCVQSCSWDEGERIRIPDEADFRWQVYTMLSFGAVTIFLYVFSSYPKHVGTPFGPDGEKTELWYASKRITSEVRGISDLYVQYRNIGAFNVNCTDETPYLAMFEPLSSFSPIADIQCDQPLLVGCFERTAADPAVPAHAFTLVNMTDPAEPASLEARIKLQGNVVAYYGGQPLAMTPHSDGYYHFPLIAGDGVFVTVDG